MGKKNSASFDIAKSSPADMFIVQLKRSWTKPSFHAYFGSTIKKLLIEGF